MKTRLIALGILGLAALLPVRFAAVGAEPIRIVVSPSSAQAAPEGPGADAAPHGGAAGEPKDLAEAMATMKFERTPEALLQALKSPRAGGSVSEAERLRFAVLLGDWAAVGQTLKALPAGDATRVYARMLEALAGSSQSAAQFYEQSAPTAPAGAPPRASGVDGEGDPASKPAQPGARRGLLLSEDFYAVIAASPADLDALSLPQVAALAKVAIGSEEKKGLLTRLETGLKGFGGAEPEGRKLAAQLLSSLGWIAEAGPYLPLKREQWDQADTLSLVLAMEFFTQTGIQQRDERQFKRAAEVCAFMMQTSRFGADDRGLFRQATDRFVKLLPALGPGEAEALIRENFLTQPAILEDLILTLAESGQQAQRTADLNQRGQSLATQSALLRVLAGRKGALPEAVNVLVMNWLTEAEATCRSGLIKPPEDEPENPFVYRPPSYYARHNAAKVVPRDVILDSAPAPALIRRMNKGLAQRLNLTLLKVNLMNPKEPETLATLTAYLKDHPGQEKELCQDYLAAWVKQRTVPPEDPNIVRMRRLGYVISSQQKTADGIPLTRLRQNKNVADYRNVLAALRALSPEPISPNAVVDGFMAIHSGAEVYRGEDIEAIFGPAESMNRAELMQLVTGMRAKLREQWQDAKVQQAAGTNRTAQEARDEVSRGYRTALDLVRRGLREQDADWPPFVVRGQLFFDAAEFEFARQVKLQDYVNLRDEAFGSYRKAAQIYAAKVPELPRAQWTLEPYQMWFLVMLGASDLSQLTRAAARSDPGLAQIGEAMRALPGDAGEEHVQKFGEMLGLLLPQVPAHMRQRFLSAGLQVVGEQHPAARAALAALRNYQELLDETQLRVTVDGPARVGHGQPFGAIVSLEHTRQIARESGGFGKYLLNQGTPRQIGFPTPGAGQANYRDDFTKNIHGALDETFEVVSITFHDAEVRALDLPREGWQETPLAYVLLRAKEAAVDRIPSIQLDMDFSDTSGTVVLPVRSQVLPIDAKDADAGPRPCADLALTFTMDERDWARDGRVVVEAAAKGCGAIPDHAQLFDFAREGFDVEVTDNGLSITEFVSDGKTKAAHADRNWQFTYKRQRDLRGAAVLKFPAVRPGIATAGVEYQHYQDADLVKLGPPAAAAGVALKTPVNGGLRAAAMILLLAVLGAGAYALRRARNRPPKVAGDALALPAQLTPFTVVVFLRRVQRDAGAAFDDATRNLLRTQIAELEAANYCNPPNPTSAVDLEAIARTWLQRRAAL